MQQSRASLANSERLTRPGRPPAAGWTRPIVAPRRAPFAADTVDNLATVAKLVGARLGLVRVMAETQLQAATDNLTGLINRRSFSERVAAIRRQSAVLSMAISDLDHFKELNDTYGHYTGDRALRLFAQVLSESVRAQDLVSRHGGDEQSLRTTIRRWLPARSCTTG